MNAFQILVAALIAVSVLYVAGTQFFTVLNQGVNISEYAQSLLLEAQGELGTGNGVTLSLKEGQTLYARNLDSTTRTVAFACAGTDCCPTLTNCTLPFSVTPDRIHVNRGMKATLTARCLPSKNLHLCKIYLGKKPAQLVLTSIETIEPVDAGTQPGVTVPVHITNSGDWPILDGEATIQLSQIQGPQDEVVEILHVEQAFQNLLPGKNQTLQIPFETPDPGVYLLTIDVRAEDAGMAAHTQPLSVTGEAVSLCARDLTHSENWEWDSFSNICRKKVFCTACDFTFECLNKWKAEEPLEFPYSYDESRGEKGFAYQLLVQNDGVCEN